VTLNKSDAYDLITWP